MIVLERPVRFDEVDAAGIVFFGNFPGWAHEAMERFFGAMFNGDYAGLILERKIGLPAVHVDMKFHEPLRYGDVVLIETSCAKLGNRSAVLRYKMVNRRTRKTAAELLHTIVTTNLVTMESCDMPDDVRAQLAAHLEPAPSA